MISSRTPGASPGLRGLARWTALAGLVLPGSAFASEAELQLPDLSRVTFLGGTSGRSLLMWGLLVCLFGFGFGVYQFAQLRKLPVHKAMLEISELIYETCKTYLVTQGKFILALEVLIGGVMILYFGVLQHMDVVKVVTILAFSLIGIAGSYGVAWFGIRVNTFANSPDGVRQPPRQAVPGLRHPAAGGDEHRHGADQHRAADHALHPALRPGRLSRDRASSASPSASRSAPRPSGSPAASSPRSRTSARTS